MTSVKETLLAAAKELDKVSLEDVKSILRKLVVKPGGIGTSKKINDYIEVIFGEAPRGSGVAYALDLNTKMPSGKIWKQTVGLNKEQYFTKSKSPWAKDNTWRLTESAINNYSEQIVKLANDNDFRKKPSPAPIDFGD